MTASPDLDQTNATLPKIPLPAPDSASNPDDELPGEVEMTLFEHLEELRWRIFAALGAAALAMVICFIFVRPIVRFLEVPAHGIKITEISPGEFFFASIEVAGYSGLFLATPFILYQIIQFVLPGLTRSERRLVLPAVVGSSVLFIVGLVFGYQVLIPAAFEFFINYTDGTVEQAWKIKDYLDLVLDLLLKTALAFQIPALQVLLGLLGLVSSQQMSAGWRYVFLGAVVLGAVLTPSGDPLTQGIVGGTILGLYFGGVGVLKLLGR